MQYTFTTILTLSLALPAHAMDNEIDGFVIVHDDALMARCKAKEDELKHLAQKIDERLKDDDIARHFDSSETVDYPTKDTCLCFARFTLTTQQSECQADIRHIQNGYEMYKAFTKSPRSTQDYDDGMVKIEKWCNDLYTNRETALDKEIIKLLLSDTPISYKEFYALILRT